METNALINFNNLQKVLEEYGELVVEHYKQHLMINGHIATEKLITSVKVMPVNGYEVSISLEEYWKRVEYNNRPHWAPPQAILNWVKAKRIVPSKTYDGKLPTEKQLAFLINRAMAGESPNQSELKNPKGGTTGTHDLEKSIEEVNAIFEVRIVEALSRDIESIASGVLDALR